MIVSGDHGESLGAHGEPTHGMLVFEPAIRVPLVMRAPGVTPAVRDDAASIVDIAPTVLALAGLASTGTGRNLLELQNWRGDLESYSESEYPRVAAWAPARSLVRDRWKMIVSARPMLFNLADDPDDSAICRLRNPRSRRRCPPGSGPSRDNHLNGVRGGVAGNRRSIAIARLRRGQLGRAAGGRRSQCR